MPNVLTIDKKPRALADMLEAQEEFEKQKIQRDLELVTRIRIHEINDYFMWDASLTPDCMAILLFMTNQFKPEAERTPSRIKLYEMIKQRFGMGRGRTLSAMKVLIEKGYASRNKYPGAGADQITTSFRLLPSVISMDYFNDSDVDLEN